MILTELLGLVFLRATPSKVRLSPGVASFYGTSTPLYIFLNFPVSTFFFSFLGALA